MPLRKQGTFSKFAALLALGVACATPATAAAATCAEQATTKAFAKFGDEADYSLAPQGDFESGAAGWTLKNADIVDGNETAGVLPGRKSLALGGGLVPGPSEAVSPEFCVSDLNPHFRFLVQAKGPISGLSTYVRFRVGDTPIQLSVPSKVTTSLRGDWAPSVINPLATRLPLLLLGGSAKVQLVFKATAAGSGFGLGYRIDNVLVDPYRRG